MTDYRSKPPQSSVSADFNDNGFSQQERKLSHDAANGASTVDPESGVKRGLKTRHLSMMALAGIIGPGLLVGSGGTLASGGPASLLIGFGLIGIIAFSIMQSLGEITTLYPSGGAFTSVADRFVDKAFGAAVGWNYFIIWVAVLANEYNAISAIFVFWAGDKVPVWGLFLTFWFAFQAFQLLGVKAFGEAEFWLALIKLGRPTAFFVFAIIYAAGGLINQAEPLGFRYWHDPGPWVNGFRGVATVFVFCSTFYAGVESVAVAATETRNPSVAVPLAIRQVFARIIFIYMGSAFFFGLTCPSNATGLASGSSSGRALRSPMTIAIQNAGWESGAAHLINTFIFLTCLSAINSSIYIGSRTVLFMAQDGKAPKFLRLDRTNSHGVPVYAIIFTNLFGALSLMNISTGAGKAYNYIVNLSGVSTFLVWGSISFIHIRFRQAWAHQNSSISELPFKSFGYPYNAYLGLFANIFLGLVQGWPTLSPFEAGNFIDAYLLLPLFPVVYFGFKLWNRTRFWRLSEIDLDEGGRRDVDEKTADSVSEEKGLGGSDAARVRGQSGWKRILKNL
jgi:yeast amino acid transporter